MDKRIDELKGKYGDIEVPNKLDLVIASSIKRGKNEMKKQKAKRGYFKIFTAIAATLMVFVIGINTSPTFAETIKTLPGGDTIVSVLQFNKNKVEGGEINDGQDIKDIDAEKQKDSERLTVDLFQGDQPATISSHFSVTQQSYPYSIIVELNGVRAFTAMNSLPDLSDMVLFDDIYRLITLDDSAHRFVVTFKKPVIVEITEQQNPGKIIIDVKEDTEAENLPEIYSLRTGSYPFGEYIGVAEGILRWELGSENTRMLKDKNGTYFVEEGYYLTEEEALARMSVIQEHEYFDYDLYVERRDSSDVPKLIKD